MSIKARTLIIIATLLVACDLGADTTGVNQQEAEVTQEKKTAVFWQRWSPSLFEQAKKVNRLVLVDFAAEWCHFCKKWIRLPGAMLRYWQLLKQTIFQCEFKMRLIQSGLKNTVVMGALRLWYLMGTAKKYSKSAVIRNLSRCFGRFKVWRKMQVYDAFGSL